MRLIVILLSFVAFVAGGFPPKFPENCQLTGTAASHQVSSSSEFGTIAGCVVTGNSCQSNSECAAIDTSSMCQGKTVQRFVKCFQGFYEFTSQNVGDYCDCTMDVWIKIEPVISNAGTTYALTKPVPSVVKVMRNMSPVHRAFLTKENVTARAVVAS